jgi:hypothetical protein
MKIRTIASIPQPKRLQLAKYLLSVALLLMLVVAVFATAQQAPSTALPSGSQVLSVSDFELHYGLQVRLIGVTAGGGMVDFRLKMTDTDKARQFLQDPAHMPVMLIAEDGSEILAADTMDEEIEWKDDGILFMMLPNSQRQVQSGTSIMVKFGDLVLEPVLAQ